MKQSFITTLSLMLSGVATGSAFTGDQLTAWIMTICNAAVLIANVVIQIYRKWRDRDKDLKEGKEEKKDEEDVE